jgi:hypothetical protein
MVVSSRERGRYFDATAAPLVLVMMVSAMLFGTCA